MGLRVKSRWMNGSNKTMDKHGEALAFIAWRIAKNSIVHMEQEGFQVGSVEQRLDMIVEFIIYLTHLADRLVYDTLDDKERQLFIIGMVQGAARTLQSSAEDIRGKKDYKKAFIDKLNTTMADYAECGFANGKPGFSMLRCFGDKIAAVLGGEEDTKWLQDQIMEIEAPEALQTLEGALRNLIGVH